MEFDFSVRLLGFCRGGWRAAEGRKIFGEGRGEEV